MEFRLLGPLEVRENGRVIEVGSTKPRALLAILLLNANRVVSTDALIAALWGERPPGTASKALQVYVSQLRKALGRDRIVTRSPGYELRVEAGELDLQVFEQRVAEGEYGDALALVRGSPLSEFAYEPFAQAEIARIGELELACLEERIDGDLAQGRHAATVGELEALVREHPLRERLRGQLMIALYRSGRQADALEAYQAGRAYLSDELGLEPGAALKELQRSILAQDPTLDPPVSPACLEPTPVVQEGASAPRAREARKTVSVLFCDLTASGRELDPESLRHIAERGFEAVVPVLNSHGATVERSIDGAVSAIFGVPTLHEDDALRAVRAAVGIGERLAELRPELDDAWGARLDPRIGIGTGEVLASGESDSDRRLVTGPPVQVAIRLQQKAKAGEILVDERTLRVVRPSVEAESLGDHARVLEVHPVEHGRRARFDSPMVGREREGRRLRDAFEQAVGDRSCQLFTILGAPGVGKSRLVQEFVGEVAESALVARGRCLPYGEGITYWPVLEVVRDAAGLDDSDSPEDSRERLASILEGDDEAALVAERLAEVIGLSATSGGGLDEAFWAVRTFFEALARRRSLVVVFDDIHWGETTFLDLVDYVSEWMQDAPILLVCVARPELLDVRPQWGGGKLNSTSIRLEPLSEAESGQLVDNLAGALEGAARQQVVEAAGGNPLFVEEMLAFLLEDGRARASLEVPPTIQALLAARLDRLPDDERAAVEAAAVEGKVFHAGAAAELAAASVDVQLLALVRKELIRPERPLFSGEHAYAFRHLLIRDVAYESIPKESRAVMHERFAAWLEQRAGDRRLEFEEILGYHLEQAFRFRSELGPVDAAGRELARGAGQRLGRAGRRALSRGDTSAAMNLVSRAAALLPADDPFRIHVVPGVRIVQGLGGQLGWVDEVLTDALESGDPGLQAHARVQGALMRLFTETTVDVDEVAAEATEAITVFEQLEDELGLARAWRLLQQARYLGRQSAASAEAAEHALAHARRAGDILEEVEIIDWAGVALFMGATPAAEAARRVESHLERTRGGRVSESVLLGCLSGLTAMQGDFATARALAARARPFVEPAHMSRQYVVAFHIGWAELIADDPVAAEQALSPTLEPLEAIGETSGYSAIVALLAEALYRQKDYARAEALTRTSEEASHLNDVFAHITWRRVRAKAAARRGDFDAAERLMGATLAFASESDFLNAHGDALLDLAEVLELAGRSDEATPAVEEALRLFERKGNVVSAGRARTTLERLGKVA